MSQLVKGIATGTASGIVSCAIATFALARTSAFVLPSSISLAVWDTVVVFGLGVTLIALIVHFAALTLVKPKLSLALLGFMLTYASIFAFSGLLPTGMKALVAAVIGALLATGIARLRSNNSFNPMPLRGTG